MSSKNIGTSPSSELNRRGFLRVSALGTGALALGGSSLLTSCDPGELMAPDANGIRLHPFFKSRVVATTGETVKNTNYTWHLWPDGGGVFPLPDGGWSYVSNSEWFFNNEGGAGASYIRFGPNGGIIGAGRVLSGTLRNCSGGITPWGTWLSCEEVPTGGVWECDPLGAVPAVLHAGMGKFMHEAAACDPVHQVVYLTEDVPDGGLYRFVPNVWGDLSTGVLQVLTEPLGGPLSWETVPDPLGDPTATRYQVPDTKIFAGGEGIDLSNGNVIFTTKGDDKVWSYDPVANTLTVLYDANSPVNGILTGVDNVETSSEGVIYVCEDGGDMQIVLVREDGSTFPVLQVADNPNSEICGAAFDPSGTRLYFSDQRGPGRTIEVRGPWELFTEPGPFQWPA